MRNALGFLLVGVAVGAAINMLMSSSQKKAIRNKLYKGTEDFMDGLKDKIRTGNEMINEYAELAESRIEMLNKKIKTIEKTGA